MTRLRAPAASQEAGWVEAAVLGATWLGEVTLGWELQALDESTGVARLAPPVLAVVNVTLLTRRRVHPLAVLVAIGVLTVAGSWLPLSHPFLAAYVAYYAAVGRGSFRRALWLLAGFCVVLVVVSYRGVVTGHERHPALSMLLLFTLFASAAVVLLIVARRFGADARHVAELERRRSVAVAEAVAAERLRIARELHDIVAHAVSVIVLQAAGARAVFDRDPARTQQALADIEDLGAQAMGELRRLLGVLRSTTDDGEIEPRGLDDLPALIRQADLAGLRVTLTTTGEPAQLAPSLGLAVYRLVQEGLTNAAKHAGPGTDVAIRLSWSHREDGPLLEVTVEDHPAAMTHPRIAAAPSLSAGLGLVGLRERITAVGGHLEAGALPPGFRLRAALPAGPDPRTRSTTLPADERLGNATTGPITL